MIPCLTGRGIFISEITKTMINTQTLQFTDQLTKIQEKALLVLLVIPLAVSIINATYLVRPAQAFETANPIEERLIDLTNAERGRIGLRALTFNSKLSIAAEQKATDMLAKGYFDHQSPDGRAPWDFIESTGYIYLKAGENLAIDFPELSEVVPAWMASPTHKANIVKPDYEEIGIAHVQGNFNGRQTTVIVQMFGTKPVTTEKVLKALAESISSPLPF